MTSPWSQEKYIAAYRFAARAHWNSQNRQCVPGTELPYLMHFSLVAMEVMAALERSSGLDGDLAVQSALLHDTLEDTATTHEQLMDRFGPGVADGVRALTKKDDLGSDLPQGERNRIRMADSLKRIQRHPREIWMVKMADRITNLQPPPKGWSREKIDRYRLEAVEIHQALKEASPYLAHRLQNKITTYARQEK